MSIKRWKLGWKRCDCVKCDHALTIEQTEENCGWVMWEHHKEEVARLKAEVERLKAELADEKSANANVEGRMNSANRGLSMRNHLLQAEVERLTAEKDQAECDHDNCQKRKVSIDNHRFDLFTENKTLKAEVERLKSHSFTADELTSMKAETELLHAQFKRDLFNQVVEENERLRKAGDALADAMSPFRLKPFDTPYLCRIQHAWNAAKEGKQP